MEYYSGSVSPESSRMVYITWGVNQGLIFFSCLLQSKLKLEQFIQNLLKKIMETEQ